MLYILLSEELALLKTMEVCALPDCHETKSTKNCMQLVVYRQWSNCALRIAYGVTENLILQEESVFLVCACLGCPLYTKLLHALALVPADTSITLSCSY